MIYLIIVLAIITRFIPHPFNFAPITAIAIFSAANLPWKKAVGLTLAARFISDIFLGFFSWPLMLAVYASHLIGIAFGLWIRKTISFTPTAAEGSANKQISRFPFGKLKVARNGKLTIWTKIIASSLSASIVFFLVTNFAFLYSNYPHNLTGIIQSYLNGLPFLRGTVIGDLSYTFALFGMYQLVLYVKSSRQRKSPAIA